MTGADRDEWLEWRRSGIGASDVAAIIGLSPWQSPWSVWASKLDLLIDEDTEAKRAGRWLESAIAPWFAAETGLHVAGQQTWCTHPEHQHHLATVDGFVLEGQAALLEPALGDFEVKVTGPGRKWALVPEHYQAQGQWQMHVTGMDRCWFAVLMGRRLDIHELKRDRADIDFLIERVDAFWAQHVVTGDPPPIDGSDATAQVLHDLFPGDLRGEIVEADAELASTVRQWKTAKSVIKEHQANEKLLANKIRAMLGDATELYIDGEQAASWRKQTTRRLDQKRLKGELGSHIAGQVAELIDLITATGGTYNLSELIEAVVDEALALGGEFTTESESRVLRSHTPKHKEG